MFLKYGTSLFNLNRMHLRLDGQSLHLFDTDIQNPLTSLTFKSATIASFSFGRIIHGILNEWCCVDVTEKAIEELMEKVRLKGNSPVPKTPEPKAAFQKSHLINQL